MENKNSSLERFAINFSSKQVSKPREHTGGKIDVTTGKTMLFRKLYIPSKEYRPDDIDLGIDSNGIDRNERKGYINIPDHLIYQDKRKDGRMYTYFNSDRQVKINFSGEKTGRMINGKPEYDSPEPLVMNAKEFAHIYDGKPREQSRMTARNQDKEKQQTKQMNIKKTSPVR